MLMRRRPPIAKRTDTLFPSTTLIRSIETQRAADLFEKQSGTASNRDNTAAQKLKADASLQRARAELKTAEIDLDRTTIRAPIGGAIGLSETDRKSKRMNSSH